MTVQSLSTIPFHGASLLALAGETPEATLVAMKPIAEGMGLDWEPQRKRIARHPVLSEGASVMEVPSAGGPQATIALRLPMLNFWLATIHPDRVKDLDVRERILTYQRECADVLFRHFFGKAGGPADRVAAQPEAAPALPAFIPPADPSQASLERQVEFLGWLRWLMGPAVAERAANDLVRSAPPRIEGDRIVRRAPIEDDRELYGKAVFRAVYRAGKKGVTERELASGLLGGRETLLLLALLDLEAAGRIVQVPTRKATKGRYAWVASNIN